MTEKAGDDPLSNSSLDYAEAPEEAHASSSVFDVFEDNWVPFVIGGGVCLFVIVVLVIAACLRRRKKRKDPIFFADYCQRIEGIELQYYNDPMKAPMVVEEAE